MKDLTVYQRMTSSCEQLIKVVNTEVGTKCCQPFAVRAFDALNSLGLKTEEEAKIASNTFLDNLQALIQGGILSEDYDKLDFVKRGKVITISARVQALIRAARRKGFMIVESVVAVPKGDDVYFEEEYKDGAGIIYLLKDKRGNPDREITPQRLIDGYFSKFLCRLAVREVKSGHEIMTTTEMTNQEVLRAQSASDNGLYKSEWVEFEDRKGNKKKRKVVYDGQNGTELKLNFDSIWYKWTAEMVKKTIIRRALKNIKEALPELSDTFMAFDADVPSVDGPAEVIDGPRVIEVDGINNINVDLHNLTEDQKSDVEELFEIYKQNPANAKLDAENIRALYESEKPLNEIINEYYAELVNLSKSKNLYPLIKNIIEGVPYEKNEH